MSIIKSFIDLFVSKQDQAYRKYFTEFEVFYAHREKFHYWRHAPYPFILEKCKSYEEFLVDSASCAYCSVADTDDGLCAAHHWKHVGLMVTPARYGMNGCRCYEEDEPTE